MAVDAAPLIGRAEPVAAVRSAVARAAAGATAGSFWSPGRRESGSPDPDGSLALRFAVGARGAVLVQPDGFVAWQAPSPSEDRTSLLRSAVELATGRAGATQLVGLGTVSPTRDPPARHVLLGLGHAVGDRADLREGEVPTS